MGRRSSVLDQPITFGRYGNSLHQKRSRSRLQPSMSPSSGSGRSNPGMFLPGLGPKVSPLTTPGTPWPSQHIWRICPPSVLLTALPPAKEGSKEVQCSRVRRPCLRLRRSPRDANRERGTPSPPHPGRYSWSHPTLKTGSPDDPGSLPKGKEALGKPQAPGHTTPDSDLNVNHKLWYPWRHTCICSTDQGTATTPTTTTPSRPCRRTTSKDMQDI